MAKPKGSPKTGGRQKGSPNKVASEIKEIARQYGPQAVQELAKLAGLVDEGAGKAESEQARIGALNGLLDRGYGKPTQAISGAADGRAPLFPKRIEIEIVGKSKV